MSEDQSERKELPGCVHMFLAAIAVLFLLFFVVAVMSVGARLPREERKVDTSKPPSAEELRDACKVLRSVYGRRAMSDIPLDTLDQINACRTLGIW
jgi:hypothetical protein